jgi:hypothetical protein
MNREASQTNIIFICALMIIGVLARLLPNLPNFSPYIGIALFGGAMLPKRAWAVVGVTVMLYLADLLINNTVSRQFFTGYEGIVWGAPYMIFNLLATIAMVIYASYLLRKPSFANVGLGTFIAAVLFFVVSNFGVWVTGEVAYPKTMAGLIQCYTAAIPFFRGTLMSGIVYSALLFGGYEIIKRWIFVEKLQKA